MSPREPVERTPLQNARYDRGWSQRDAIVALRRIAERQGARLPGFASMQAQLSHWERSRVTPSPFYQRLLCHLYDATAVQLGFALPAAKVAMGDGGIGGWGSERTGLSGDTDDVQRRAFMKLAAMSGISAVVPPMAGRNVDEPAVASVESLAASYRRLYHSAAPSDLLVPVQDHLRGTTDLLRAPAGGAARIRLLAARSEVAALAGRLSFFDLRDPIRARGYYDLALEAAREAGDDRLALNSLAHLSFVPASEGRFAAAGDYLGRAAGYGRRAGDALMTAWLAAVESEQRTNAGDHDGALRALDRAEHDLDGVEEGRRPDWFDYFDGTRLAGFQGFAYLGACRYDEAHAVLTQALGSLPTSAVKQRTVFLSDLAEVHVRRGDLQEGCRLAVEAADGLSRAGYATGAQRLRTFRSRLVPLGHERCVRDLDERLAGLAA